MTGEQAYDWLAPKLSKPEREALDVLRAENERLLRTQQYHPCTFILIQGLKKLPGGDVVLAEWDKARAFVDKPPNAAFSRPPEVDG